jgi:hypothetical protein
MFVLSAALVVLVLFLVGVLIVSARRVDAAHRAEGRPTPREVPDKRSRRQRTNAGTERPTR